jgi:prolyl-tRNA editing enzyme YbaK/EbsC (Cys-tRNA(Pro) deacylase)
MQSLSTSARKVQAALDSFGLDCRVQELPSSTRTAKEAAQALGCRVSQIVKSLVFMGARTRKPLLLLVSGSNRVDEAKLAALIGEPVKKAGPDFVREKTGFVIGGVPPLGQVERLETFIDRDLLEHETLWAAAGTPRAVFRLRGSDLLTITAGRVIAVG